MATLAQIPEPKHFLDFKRVLIATDFSAASERALAYALPIVRRYGSVLSIVHAIPPEARESVTFDPLPRALDRRRLKAEQEMGHLAEETPIKELNPHMSLEYGRVWDVLSSVIQREDIDLLVLGTHGRGGLKKLALGSVAEEVLRLAAFPVLTIGPNVPPVDPAKTGFRSILFATDFGPASSEAFPYALSLAEDCRAKLILMHMVPLTAVADATAIAYCPGPCAVEAILERQRTRKEESAQRLQALLPWDTELQNQVEYVVGGDLLPEGILSAAELHKADLIVMGANRTRSARVAAHIPWTLTHDVICKARCPVLTVSG